MWFKESQNVFSKQFSKEFGTILHKNEGDIETNFDNFLKWNNFLKL